VDRFEATRRKPPPLLAAAVRERFTRLRDAPPRPPDFPVARLLAYLRVTVTPGSPRTAVCRNGSDTNDRPRRHDPVEYDTDTGTRHVRRQDREVPRLDDVHQQPRVDQVSDPTDDPEVSVSAVRTSTTSDALEPIDPETIAPHPDVEYTTTAEVTLTN